MSQKKQGMIALEVMLLSIGIFFGVKAFMDYFIEPLIVEEAEGIVEGISSSVEEFLK